MKGEIQTREENLNDDEIHSIIKNLNPKEYKEKVKKLLNIHQKLVEKEEGFHKTRFELKYGVSSGLSVGYFGSQGRFYVPFLKEYFEKVLKFKPTYFAETPAGSNSISYGMIQYDIPIVATNDISFWSYCISRGILKNDEILTDDEVSTILKQSCNGYLVNKREDLPMPLEVKQNIDGVVRFIKEKNIDKYYTILAILGKFMLSNLTFRSMTWDKNRMKDSNFCSVSVLHNYIKKWVKKFNVLIQDKGKDVTTVLSYQKDHKEFINSISPPSKGSVLYCDFDWPWSDGRETEVYTWYIEDISSIIFGDKIQPNISYWTKHNIKKELLGIIKLSLEKFEYMFLSTQSSNYPHIEVLKEWVTEVAKIVDYCFIDTLSLVANKNFREELLILKRK